MLPSMLMLLGWAASGVTVTEIAPRGKSYRTHNEPPCYRATNIPPTYRTDNEPPCYRTLSHDH